jgi:hypothetical protein
MGTITVGQMVHYHGLNGVHYAAIIVALDGCKADLAVFMVELEDWQRKGLNVQLVPDVVTGIGPGNWHCLIDCQKI